MGLATRLVESTTGELRMFGVPVDSPGVMPRYAFLGQEKALFKRFTGARRSGWGRSSTALGRAVRRRISYPIDAGFPAKLSDAVQVDNWVSTASGELFGYGACVQEEKYEACLADEGIVNATSEYFGYGQMPVMQWTGVGILGGLSVLLIAFIVVRVGRRPL